MTTIWVVEQGYYSDYRVVGVFSSREHAERARQIAMAYRYADEASIAEWPLDPGIAEMNAGYRRFEVSMQRDGSTTACAEYEPDSTRVQLINAIELWGSDSPLGRRYLHAVVWATDADHAVNIANEKRGQMIASGEWTP